jgi:hypothetical protein
MYLLLLAVGVVIMIACAPFVMLWEDGGSYGPAMAAMLAAVILAGLAYSQWPSPQTFPADASQLRQITGSVIAVTAVSRGGVTERYELSLDGPVKRAQIRRTLYENDARGLIGQRIVATCFSDKPDVPCEHDLVQVSVNGRSVIDEHLKEFTQRQAVARLENTIMMGLLVAAGLAAAIGFGLALAQRNRN